MAEYVVNGAEPNETVLHSRDEWAAGFSAGCDAVEAAYEDGRPFYEVENAKLRELVLRMWPAFIRMKRATFADRLHVRAEIDELGVEVD